MDSFFQKLRNIQKKEMAESGLARVGEDFYPRVHAYIDMLMDKVESNPFAEEEHRLLKNTQIIATDICARREHKIADTAVNNIQRSYHLFQGKKPQFDSQDTTPLNLTPEEEQLYFSLMDTVRSHRTRLLPSLNIMGGGLNSTPNDVEVTKPSDNQTRFFETEEQKPVVDIFDDNNEDNELSIVKKPIENDIPKEDSKVKEDTNLSGDIPKVNPQTKKESLNKPINNEKIQFTKKIDESKSVNQNNSNLSEDIYASIYGEEEFVDLPPEVPVKPYEINRTPNMEFDPDKISFKTLVIFDEVPSIVGVDEKVYGPFYPQDVVKMPELNADLFRKRRKGRFVKI